ncbi:MAG: hypothetical protein AB1585_15510 [Thermodesulfobacteriota bacterium]
MGKLKWVVLGIALLLAAGIGCSGGSDGGGGSFYSAPGINVSYENPTLRRGERLYFNISWNDPDGDIETLHLEEYYGTARFDHVYSASANGITGTSGSKRFYFDTNPSTTIGYWTFKMFVKDSRGYMSNVVSATIHFYAKENALEKGTVSSSVQGLGQ